MRNAILTAALAGVLAVTGTSGVAAASEPETRAYTGVIDGAEYRVEVPGRWNGRLLLFSHGFYPPGYVPDVAVVNQAAAKPELLDQGYALAASNYRTPDGYAVKHALVDQIALLDWFSDEVGKPQQVLAWGASMGGLISTLLAERNPDRIDGVLPMCAPLAGTVSHLNQGLDAGFVVRTLLGADADLVDITDPDGNEAAAVKAVQDALATPSGRARFSLAATVAGIPAWSRALEPRPTELDARIDQQADHVVKFLALLIWGAGRASVEERAGGNPSGNAGIDYAELLSRAGERDLVVDAYRQAGLDLDADLARLD
ncbi:MAG: alpha/beta fold hydrolase, partial [Micromonosporaceae bacterium]